MTVSPENFKDRREYKYVVYMDGHVGFCGLEYSHKEMANQYHFPPVWAGRIRHLDSKFDFSDTGSVTLGIKDGGRDVVSKYLLGYGITESEEWLYY